MEVIKGGITAPLGFKASGLHCGLKKHKRLDLAIVYSEVPAKAVGLFTTNNFFSSSIELTRERLRKKFIQAIIINSGCANCGLGEKGYSDAKEITKDLAEYLGLQPEGVLIASTGIIGRPLAVGRIKRAIPELVKSLSKKNAGLASRAIMTTDTRPKQVALKINLWGREVKIGGMAKGAGMIHPNLATMLCFITTDVDIEYPLLKKAVYEAGFNSFNCISVDGDTSTNDTLLVLANGLAKNKKITTTKSKDFSIFSTALKYLCQNLARQIVLDGEGATKFIEINVKGANTKLAAQRLARRIATSSLVKTAIYGENPNWGRILACCGSAELRFNPKKLEISFGNIVVFRNGKTTLSNRNRLKKILAKKEIQINVNLHQGKAYAFVWSCDLTEEYVRINAGYE